MNRFSLPRESIVTRLLKRAFGVYVAIAAVIVLLEVWSHYTQTRERIALNLRETQSLVENGLENAVWYVDQPLTLSLLEGVLNRTEVAAVTLSDLKSGQKVQLGDEEIIDTEAEKSGRLYHQFSLFQPEEWGTIEPQAIAQVELYSASNVVWSYMMPVIQGLLLAALAKAAALWVIFLYFGWRMVSLPLNELRRFVIEQGLSGDAASSSNEGEIASLDRSIRLAHERSENALKEKIDKVEALLASANVELQREQLASQLDQGYKWELDLESQMLTSDDTLRRWMGLAHTDTNTWPVSDLITLVPPEWQDWLAKEIQDSIQQAMRDPNYILTTQHPLIRRDVDKAIWVKVVGKVLDIDNRKVLIGSTFDINEQIEAQTELRKLLDQHQGLLNKQKEMFAVIGHELRTPVAAISMVGRDADIDAVSARSQIVEISENLLSVLEDLRVVVAPERALEAKNQERCDPVRTINRALSPLSQLMKQNAVELRLSINKPEGTEFLLHAQPLRQVAKNLTKNATIHSGGSVVQVSFDYQSDADGNTVGYLIVEDDGRGIPEALLEQVFEPFGRGYTERDGSGLGLFIVKQVAELMDGTIEYCTSQLGGACFTLTFPMKKVEVEKKPQASVVSLEGLRILLAEDDAMLRMLTEKSLGKLGAQLASFDNGQKALAAFETDQFDLVLTDLMMPMMNGHELTKSLRDLGAKIPIIGVTAAVIGDETDEWLKDGANAFISKPITPEKLQNALDMIGFTPADGDLAFTLINDA